MKKLMTILLAAIFVFSMTACGNKDKAVSQPDEASSTSQVKSLEQEEDTEPAADGEMISEEEYEAEMGEFMGVFETLIEQVNVMITNFDDSDEWYTDFAEIYTGISGFSEELAGKTDQVPESYQESHINITVAVAAYADMMNAVGSAADAYKAGDEAKGDELMLTAQGLYEGANELWNEAKA